MREETRKGSGGNMLGGRNVLFEVNVSVRAEKSSPRSSPRDCVRFLRVACTQFFLKHSNETSNFTRARSNRPELGTLRLLSVLSPHASPTAPPLLSPPL